MGATGHKGVDVRQTGNRIVFRASLKDSSGAKVTSGTTSLYIYELQDDGSLKSYDFSSNTFKTTALTTETASMTHQSGNNSGTTTGLWTYVLSTLTGFTAGALYFAVVSNSSASPAQQEREFQYGSAEGDLVVTANGTGVGEINSDLMLWRGTQPLTLSSQQVQGVVPNTQKVDVETIKTQAITCAAGVTVSPYVGSTGAAVNGTTVNTLAGHDPGETIMGATDLDATLAAINSKTTNLPSDPADESLIIAATDAIMTRLGTPAGASVSADIAAVLAKWTTAVTESYAADGSAPTPEQALMMILQSLHEFAISGTTRTVKKLDGSTTAMTFTLDDASAPTSTTRAS